MEGGLLGNYKTRLEKFIAYSVIVIVIGSIVWIFWFQYWLLKLLFPKLLAVLIVIYSIYSLLLLLIRFLVFPGSFWLWKRGVEVNFGQQIARRTAIRVKQLTQIVKYLHDKDTEPNELDPTNEYELLEVFLCLRDLKSSIENCPMNERQKLFAARIGTLFENMKHTNENNHLPTLFHLFQNPSNLVACLKEKHLIISDKSYKLLLQDLTGIEIALEDISEIKEKRIDRLRQWFFNNTIGTASQIKAELMRKFKCQQIQYKSYDKVLIDGLFIYGDQYSAHSHNNLENAVNNNDDAYTDLPTIIFCNPNAGYYEFLYYSSDWIEFYTKHKINLVLWNYRGYSASGGSPTPQKLCRDGERLVEHLREKYKLRWIGVHGESLGGVFSSHIASRQGLDFLFSDRTFSSLSDVANFSLGNTFKVLLRLLTNWDRQMAKSFVSARCYKVLGYDPRDQVIPYLAQLQNGVSRDIVDVADSLRRRALQSQQLDAINRKKAEKNAISLDVYHYYYTQNDEQAEEDISENMKAAANGVSLSHDQTETTKNKKSHYWTRCGKWFGEKRAFYRNTFSQDARNKIGSQRVLSEKVQSQLFVSLREIVKLIRDIDKHNSSHHNSQKHDSGLQKTPDKLKKVYQGTPANKLRKHLEKSFQVFLSQDQELDINEPLFLQSENQNPDNLVAFGYSNQSDGSTNQSNGSSITNSSNGRNSDGNNIILLNDSQEHMIVAKGTGNGSSSSANSNGSGSGVGIGAMILGPADTLSQAPGTVLAVQMPSPQDQSSSDGSPTLSQPTSDVVDRLSYEDLLSDDAKNSEELCNLMQNVLHILEMLDAGGLTLCDIFLYFNTNQQEVFEQFLVNIQVFGSILPQNQVHARNMDLVMCRKFAIMKMKNFIRELGNLVSEQRNNFYTDDLKKKILSDLDTIINSFRIVHDNLVAQFTTVAADEAANEQAAGNIQTNALTTTNEVLTDTGKNAQFQRKGKRNAQQQVVIELQNQDAQHQQIEQGDKRQFEIQTRIKQNAEHRGALILLECGHNGAFSRKELEIYEYHLLRAGFIDSD